MIWFFLEASMVLLDASKKGAVLTENHKVMITKNFLAPTEQLN